MTDVVVETRQGAVRGTVVAGVNTFQGISYAAPPSGERRFRPPQPVERWTGTRDALAYGATAPQRAMPPALAALLSNPLIPGDDCLNLNVWSRELGAARQPVMVWIPGGGFLYGSGAACDGSRFARDGVVCVTINYRVDVDGFLCLGDGPTNLGLLDQVAALEWVRDNIAGFGGDPDNVTVFGQSAGAVSIGMLLAMPRAAGLFRRAILQSGGAHYVVGAATARRVSERLAAQLGVAPTREAIAAVPHERVWQAEAALEAELMMRPDPQRWGEAATTMMLWHPVIDEDVIPARPIDRIVAGAGSQIDLLIGTTDDEWRLFLVSSGAIRFVTEELLIGLIRRYGLPVDAALATYRATRPGASPGDLFAAIQSDWYVRIPALRIADAHAAGPAATFVYELGWRTPQQGGLLGACHALDVAFVFDQLEAAAALVGAEPPQALADAMHAAWIGFASRGDCGWPRYDLRRRATQRFDLTSRIVDDPRAVERALWVGLR